MLQDDIPRQLPEKTGTHRCIRCLVETPDEEYFRNDHVCSKCAEEDSAFPLASTPGEANGNTPASENEET